MTGTDIDTEAALLGAMKEDPGDGALRLVYADWLEENGRGGEAEGVRWALADGKVPHYNRYSVGRKASKVSWTWWLSDTGRDPAGLEYGLFRHLQGGRSMAGAWSDYPTRLGAELDLYAAYARRRAAEGGA